MIFWIDAQLPPGLAPWLTTTFGVASKSVRFLGLRDAEDERIFNIARESGNVVLVSKDHDFVEMVMRHGAPPKVLWVTCGNVTNRRLREVFGKLFPDALRMLESGEDVVEIGDISSHSSRSSGFRQD